MPTAAETHITAESWGTHNEQEVILYTLTSSALTVALTNYGARIVRVLAPDRTGATDDIVLGYDTLAGYVADTAFLGATVGRYANRIANARFTLDGATYTIPITHGTHALHGGAEGFDRRVWTPEPIPDGIAFTLISPSGDMGFPGTVTARAEYALRGAQLHLRYTATTDAPTVINLANHSYFNLRGEANGLHEILDHEAQLHATTYTPVDKTLIPIGEIAPVDGTPLDFRTRTRIGDRIDADNDELRYTGGYDHNYIPDGTGLRPAGDLRDPHTGRTLHVETSQPGVQFYSGNHLEGKFTSRHGHAYAKRTAFCLETQHFPDSPNHPTFPTTTLRPGETFTAETTYTFGIDS